MNTSIYREVAVSRSPGHPVTIDVGRIVVNLRTDDGKLSFEVFGFGPKEEDWWQERPDIALKDRVRDAQYVLDELLRDAAKRGFVSVRNDSKHELIVPWHRVRAFECQRHTHELTWNVFLNFDHLHPETFK